MWHFSPYAWPFVAVVLVTAVLLVVAWRRRSTPAAPTFIVLMAAALVWATCALLHLLAEPFVLKVFFSRLKYLGVVTVPVAWLLFAFQFTGRHVGLRPRVVAALSVVPVLTLAVLATNAWHGLFFAASAPWPPEAPVTVANTYGPWFVPLRAYSYLLVLGGMGLLLRHRLSASPEHRTSATLAALGAVCPLVMNVVFMSRPAAFGHIDYTPVAFTLSIVLFAWAVFRFHLLGLAPVSRAALIEDLPDAVLVLDRAGRVIDANCMARHLIERPLVGQLLEDVLPPLAATPLPAELTLGPASAPLTFTVRRTLLPSRLGAPYGYLLVLSDVTAMRRTQEDLQARVQLEMLLANISTRFINTPAAEIDAAIEEALGLVGAFIGVDRSYVFLRHDDLFDNTHEWCAPGISPQQANLRDVPTASLPWWTACLERFEPINVSRVEALPPEAAAEQALLAAQDIRSVLAVPMVQGQRLVGFAGFDAVRQARTWSDDMVLLLRLIGDVFVNALQHKQAEETLREAKTGAEEAAQLKASILTNMSHEIRTPLTSIIGFAQVLEQELGQEHLEFAHFIRRSGQRLLETLNSVLDLAQIEAGRMPLHLEPLDLTAAAAEAVGFFGPEAARKGLALRLGSTRPVLAHADRVLISRVFNNLVSNAIKFTDEGSVTLTVEATAEEALVHVADTGPGIGEAFLPHLFDAFRQESTGLRRRHEGSGLGLKLTRALLEHMEGRIAVESTAGAGTTFTVALPRAPAGGDGAPRPAQPLP